MSRYGSGGGGAGSAPMREWNLDCRVYIGELGYGCAKQELEDKFSKYGPLKNVWIARKPPGFAFVEFEDSRDAEDAVRALDGARINGRHARVEMSSGRSRNNKGGGGGGRGGRDFRDNYKESYTRRRSRSDSRGRRSRSRGYSNSPRRRSRSRS